MKMTSGEKIAALFIIIILGAVAFGVYTDWTWQLPEEAAVGPGPTTGEEWTGGTYELTVAMRDTLDASASMTTGTDASISYYAYRSGGWVFIGSATSGGDDQVESDPVDDGYIWVLTEEASSKYYYADTGNTVSKSTHITDYKWVDADGDTDKEFLYKISLWNIPEAASGYPKRTYYLYYYAESSQGSDADLIQWDNQPSDSSGIGTTTTTEYIDWKTKLSAEKRAAGVFKIEIVVNSTDTTKWEIDKVNIPGVGYIDGSQFTEDVRTSDTKYQYIIGSDFDDIVYWNVPSGTNNQLDNTLAVKCKFGSGEAYSFTLYVYGWLYDRTSVSDSDAVTLSA